MSIIRRSLAVFEVRKICNAAPLTPAPAAQRELLCELSVWQISTLRYRILDFIARCRKLRERLALAKSVAAAGALDFALPYNMRPMAYGMLPCRPAAAAATAVDMSVMYRLQ